MTGCHSPGELTTEGLPPFTIDLEAANHRQHLAEAFGRIGGGEARKFAAERDEIPVAREHQFRVTGHRLIITGICSQCRSARQRTRRLDLV